MLCLFPLFCGIQKKDSTKLGQSLTFQEKVKSFSWEGKKLSLKLLNIADLLLNPYAVI